MLHIIDQENILTYVHFDCVITFYPETPTKNTQMIRKRNYIPRSYTKPECITSNDQHNCFIHQYQSSTIFRNPYISWDMVPAALMSINHTNDRNSMSNQYTQPTFHQTRTDSYLVFSSLRKMVSKWKEWRVRFAFFQRFDLPDGRVNKTVATVEELSDVW